MPSARLQWAGIALAIGCRAAPVPGPAAAVPPRDPGAAPAPEAATAPHAAVPGAPDRPVLVVSDPEVLRAVERDGFDLGSVLGGAPARSADELARRPPYRVLVDAIVSDIAADRQADPRAGVGMRHAHRQFDVRWLSSEKTRFDLVSVVNRVDRRVFSPEHCGEVRFVYRLAYRVDTKTGPVDSRLPMTVNVVYFLPKEGDVGCVEGARSWLRSGPEEGEAGWLTSDAGPLSRAHRAAFIPKSVELNFQSVRWPSTVHPTLGGHAEYVLRAFRRLGKEPWLEPMSLENTVDPARLGADAALARELAAWIAKPEALRAIDRGTVTLPEKFLAQRAVSVSPHGLARRGNRPYRAAFDPRRFAALDLSPYSTIKSSAALVRRLDALSCPGCHQSRSIAGFHLLGVEPAGDIVDAVHVPMSPHFHADLGRRARYLTALAGGATPEESRPPAERGPGDDGNGARCGLGDAGFADWTCSAGLRCERVAEDEVGVCVPNQGLSVGDVCERGPIASSRSPSRDLGRLGAPDACNGGRECEATSVGFPGGMCAGSCESLPAGAVCGGIPVLVEFNACLAQGVSFDKCIAANTRPGALRACGFHAPCRDDYVCARAGDGGACLPPYFLFQLRVDGHPL